jgi:hypothetical protein
MGMNRKELNREKPIKKTKEGNRITKGSRKSKSQWQDVRKGKESLRKPLNISRKTKKDKVTQHKEEENGKRQRKTKWRKTDTAKQ